MLKFIKFENPRVHSSDTVKDFNMIYDAVFLLQSLSLEIKAKQ